MANKSTWIFIIACWVSLLLTACKDDVLSAGSSALQGDDADGVVVRSDTIHDVISTSVRALPVYTSPDSCMLGEWQSDRFGTLKADLLTQFACPEGWVYPDSSELDSVCLYIYYRSWHGDGNAPLGIDAYYLDGEPLCYDSLYDSETDINRFSTRTRSVLTKSQVVAPAQPTDSIYSTVYKQYLPVIRLRLSDAEAQQLFAIRDFSSQEAFNRQFPGLYLTTGYGSSSAMYILTLCLTIHYHFTYALGNGEYRTVSDNKVLYSNAEVKRLSHYAYADRTTVLDKLKQDTAYHYILSPANIYTQLAIPTANILSRIHDGVKDRTAYVNLAQLKIDVLNGGTTASTATAAPAKEMLLVKVDAYDRIFKQQAMPTDTTALLATLTSEFNEQTEAYEYAYTFDISTLFTQLLREEQTDTLHMLLIPVDAEYTTSSSATFLSSVRPKQSVSATRIRSSVNTDSPMDIEVVYCGFNTRKIGSNNN